MATKTKKTKKAKKGDATVGKKLDKALSKGKKARAKKAKKAKQEVDESEEDETRLRSGRLSSKMLTCLCGCGEETATPGARFLTGHDARLKGRLIRMYEERPLDEDEIPEIALPFLAEEDGLCGFRMYKKTPKSKEYTIEKIGEEE